MHTHVCAIVYQPRCTCSPSHRKHEARRSLTHTPPNKKSSKRSSLSLVSPRSTSRPYRDIANTLPRNNFKIIAPARHARTIYAYACVRQRVQSTSCTRASDTDLMSRISESCFYSWYIHANYNHDVWYTMFLHGILASDKSNWILKWNLCISEINHLMSWFL